MLLRLRSFVLLLVLLLPLWSLHSLPDQDKPDLSDSQWEESVSLLESVAMAMIEQGMIDQALMIADALAMQSNATASWSQKLRTAEQKLESLPPDLTEQVSKLEMRLTESRQELQIAKLQRNLSIAVLLGVGIWAIVR